MTTDVDRAGAPGYVPPDPSRLLVLVPGQPWPDGSRTDDELTEYARSTVRRWQPFAERHRLVLVAPIFGSDYPDFRSGGRAADYLGSLANNLIARYLPDSDGRFSLHGHSAGAQFAARFLVTHTDRLSEVVLSAPSEYTFPARSWAWPHGASGAPASADWRAAGRNVHVTVLVGINDIESRPPAPGHRAGTRLDRARAWVAAMQQLAGDNGDRSTVALRLIDGVDHDEIAMTDEAMHAFAEYWK